MTFIKQHDFTGKRIIPFCTHGGDEFCQIKNDIARECSKSIILPGIAASEEVTKWLETIGKCLKVMDTF